MFPICGNLQGKDVWTTTQSCSMVVPIELHVKGNVVHALGRHSTLHARQHRKIKGTGANEYATSFWNLSNSKGYSIAISGTSLWKLVTMPSSPTTSAQSY